MAPWAEIDPGPFETSGPITLWSGRASAAVGFLPVKGRVGHDLGGDSDVEQRPVIHLRDPWGRGSAKFASSGSFARSSTE